MGGDPWDFPSKKRVAEEALPVGCILTHSAAGSEMSSSCVISNEELNMKCGFGSDANRCLFAIMNPELTFTVGKYQTACGVTDIMAHTMERYFTVCEPTDITDRIAESVLKSVISAGRVAIDNPTDYDARANIMWASSLSHNGLTGCGRDVYLAVHQLEHALSGEFDHVAHGAGLAVLFPAWAKYVYKYNVPRFAQFARNVWGVSDEDDESAAINGIKAMSEFFALIKMPSKLSDFNVSEESIDKLSDLCTYGKTRVIKNYIPLGYEEIKNIFKLCF
jgi:alcohol dehydrogenase YqhD (iron-dependent ADH family)